MAGSVWARVGRRPAAEARCPLSGIGDARRARAAPSLPFPVVKRLLLALLPVLAPALLLPSTGLASLPRPDRDVIKVPESIGGVELKQRLVAADKAWGRTGDCDLSSRPKSCIYESRKEQAGVARIDAAARKRVSSFAIEAGRDDEGAYVFRGRLLRFETRQGIGLGDKGKKIRRHYPEAIPTAHHTGYIIEGKGRSYMTIQTLGGNRITAISVVDGKHQG